MLPIPVVAITDYSVHFPDVTPSSVEGLLQRPSQAKVDIMDPTDKTPLWWTIQYEETAAIPLLVQNGADVNEAYNDGSTPLYEAVRKKSSKIVQLLISLGAKVNMRTSNESTLLIEAIKLLDHDTVWVLLDAGAWPDDEDAKGQSALHFAVQGGDRAIIWLLIIKGAKVTAPKFLKRSGGTGIYIQSPLDLALYLNDYSTAWLLCSYGASPNTIIDDKGTTLIHWAVERGNLGAVRFLILHGVGIDTKGEGGLTPLHCAVLSDNDNIAAMLVSYAPEASTLDITDDRGNTALSLATQKKNPAITRILINKGAQCQTVDLGGLSAVHHAARLGFSDGLRMLLDSGGDPNAVDKELFTPLHYAVNDCYADSSMVKMLTAAGANLEAQDKKGRTPLMFAAQLGSEELVQCLLNEGASAKAHDRNGHVAFHYAWQFSDIQKLL